MKKLVALLLIACLFGGGLVGCSRTARGFVAGVAVAAAVATVWCDSCARHVRHCCHCRR